MALNFGDILDAIGQRREEQIAITGDQGSLTWSDFDKRSNALARGLARLGLKPGDKVGFFLFNGTAYLELLAACFKGRYVHANINFRYTSQELAYIIQNSDCSILFFDHRLSERIRNMDSAVLRSIILVEVCEEDPAKEPTIGAAMKFADILESNETGPLQIIRSPDDLTFIYTGGTTGMPRAVMWQHKQQARGLLGESLGSFDEGLSVDDVIAKLDAPKMYQRIFVACPLMHAAGVSAAITALCNGGHVIITDNGAGFDPHQCWRLIALHEIDAMVIVGDAFARPLLAALQIGNYNVSSLKFIGSSGVMWSTPVKEAMLRIIPQVTLIDALASSEAMRLGSSVTGGSARGQTATFKVGPDCKVFSEDGREIAPGSGEAGLLATSGPLPLGYFKDPEKTAETFRTMNGVRFSMPGDMCTVDSDGTVHFLGRGKNCINTAGEKVFPEEVEEALKRHDMVLDALVLGVADEKWGQAVTALVQLADGTSLTRDALSQFLRQALSGYKIPKWIEFTDAGLRMANGKPDYGLARVRIESAIAASRA